MDLKDYNLKDTITAIATFPAPAALGVIKISGVSALPVISRIFIPKKKKNIQKVKSYTLHYGWIKEADIGQNKKPKIIDEVLVSVMRAPHSYTREDVVEISSHGGIVSLNKITRQILKCGVRMAKPGEFSYRAFIYGRLDLIQAQAIVDIIEAKTPRALFSLSRQLNGQFSRRVSQIKEKLKEILLHLEVDIDFSQEDTGIDLKDIGRQLKVLARTLHSFLKDQLSAKILRQGLCCVICGKANVGKSTLFNSLMCKDRVIVTSKPGTTRDIVGEDINIKGLPLRIYDTAGILKPRDIMEQSAINKTYSKLAAADLVLLVFDASRRLAAEDILLLKKIEHKQAIFVINKIDLSVRMDNAKLKAFKQAPIVKISALKNTGLDELKQTILKLVYHGGLQHKDDLIMLAQWQVDLLNNVLTAVADTQELIKKGYTADFISFSLKPALDNLCRLTGENSSEEILKQVFSNFCIGK